MFWIVIACLGPAFHAAANILDDILTKKKMSDIWSLIFYASLFNAVFLPVIFLLSPPIITSLNDLVIIALLGLINFLYLFPYYKSLHHTDTSVVAALFSLTKVFAPLGAFIFVGEVLSLGQYIGFFIVILSSALLTLDVKSLKINPAFFLMGFSSLAVIAEGVVFKVAFESGMTWGAAFGGQSIAALLIAILLLVVTNTRKSIKKEWKTFTSILHLFALEETFTFLGSAASIYTISLVPLTFEKTVESFQPFFVLLYIFILAKLFPKDFKNNKKLLLKESLLFLCIILGTLVIALS